MVVSGKSDYFGPRIIDRNGQRIEKGYVSDIITDLCLDLLDQRDPDRPFFKQPRGFLHAQHIEQLARVAGRRQRSRQIPPL